MIKKTIPGMNSYDITCASSNTGNENIVVIISHGFGSSKESPAVLALMERLSAEGIGFFAFDFPGHGESPVDGEMFRIENCLNDLAAAEAHVISLAPEAEIMYFSSSFGAYINLIYIATRPHKGNKSFLRSAAVNMPGIFRDEETPELAKQLKEQGCIMMDMSHDRPLKVTRDFCQDLEAYDVFALYKSGMAEIAMIHGDEDGTACYEDAKRFADEFGADLITVKGGNHRLMDLGQMDLVLDKAIGFFTASCTAT